MQVLLQVIILVMAVLSTQVQVVVETGHITMVMVALAL
jgi:hypothetical protein